MNISFGHCEDLQNFIKQSRGETASLVFASSFLGSPTSYFGHTFIKINKSDNLFFSQTLGYAAELPQQLNFFDLFTKGINGGYVGKYIIAPYYLSYDNKVSVMSTKLESKKQSLISSNYFFNKNLSISLSKDFEQDENKILLMYKF